MIEGKFFVENEIWCKKLLVSPLINEEYLDLDPTDACEGMTLVELCSSITYFYNTLSQKVSLYKETQIVAALTFINSTSEWSFDIFQTPNEVPYVLKEQLLESILNLFAKTFAPLLGDNIMNHNIQGDYEQPGLNMGIACYMWWDDFFTWGKDCDDEFQLDTRILQMFSQILKIPSLACQESALHGLGHWHSAYPTDVAQIIEIYLYENRDLNVKSNSLFQYATRAAKGQIL